MSGEQQWTARAGQSPTAGSRAADICDLAPAYVRAIAPYQPGKPISELARELGLDEAGIIKLASNENPLGVSPLARRAIEDSIAGLSRSPASYPAARHAASLATHLVFGATLEAVWRGMTRR